MEMLVDHIIAATAGYMAQMSKRERKQYGQFFTSRAIAMFMAGLFDPPDGMRTIRILDPGAGTGILSAALIDRLQTCADLEWIELTCYETDPHIIGLLEEDLRWLQDHSAVRLDYHLSTENYILSQCEAYNGMLGADTDVPRYDWIIGNPPYRKISKNAAEAVMMPDICHGAPNLYSLFTAMSVYDLEEGGELVYIIPRSWTAGAYFRRFREKILSEGALEHIHLFIGRDKVFGDEDVLQETMVIKLRKTSTRPGSVTVTTTHDGDLQGMTVFHAPYRSVVSGKEARVHLVSRKEDLEVLDRLDAWAHTLPDLGLSMRTGATVDHRARDVLREQEESGAVPLFYPRHIRGGQIVFPSGERPEYIAPDRPGLLQPNANYLFLKRFTAKEEPRRLQCGIYLSQDLPKYEKISTQNKINFIGGLQPLSRCVVYGLYVLFNSTLYDQYYRIMDGSTQVNSTEMNTVPVPDMETIEAMGAELIRSGSLSVTVCDQILERFL